MFMQDQRQIEARMRTEKLASMGRLSAAVAHEIRNPLAAIVQANALLDEDLCDPRHKQLTQMITQNAARLERIVEEVLDVTRVQWRENATVSSLLELNDAVNKICQDWQEQTKSEKLLRFNLLAQGVAVRFEFEHLRRILVNLLENARRYTGAQAGAVEVIVGTSESRHGILRVWSVGEPLDQSVERHLFEPFFSSESRSSGLGLYICRQLCEEHDASIAYFRTSRKVGDDLIEGNEFRVTFQTRVQSESKRK
jgi:two-component system sensor histidine kinase PilS (NtrC family)